MSDKEINLKEKLRQALSSTVRVISEDYQNRSKSRSKNYQIRPS